MKKKALATFLLVSLLVLCNSFAGAIAIRNFQSVNYTTR